MNYVILTSCQSTVNVWIKCYKYIICNSNLIIIIIIIIIIITGSYIALF